jgi:acyl-CoA thioester hydrolase
VIESKIQVRWNDGDPLGHINNAVYFTYTAYARMELIEASLGQGAWNQCVAARVEIDYLREIPASYREVRVSSGIIRIGNSSVRTREEVFLDDGSVAARAEAVIVFRNDETGKSRPLDERERAALAPYVLPEEPEV